jgi:Immunoglobulin I-set domain
VVVSGFGTATSAPATLTVVGYQRNQVPTIASPPQSRTSQPGTTATFSVGVSGNGPFAYQWRKNGSNLADGGNVSGATSWNLTLSNVSASDAASYDVVVTGFTSTTSASAMLEVMTQTGSLILYEPFDYANIGGPVSDNMPTNWAFGGTGANDLSVVAENLSFAGLAASVGYSVANGGAGLGVRRLFGSTINSGVLYFSALFRMNDIGTTWNGNASQVGALTAPDSTSFRLAVLVRSAPGGYQIGVQKGGTGVTATFDITERHAGETVLFVGKYDFTLVPNPVSLWINPDPSTFGAATEPTSGFIMATTGSDGLGIDRFNMRQNTTTSVPAAMQWDELRIGDTWAAVTPPPPPVLTSIGLNGGAFQFGYTNGSGRTYSIYTSTNLSDWTSIGAATQISPGLYQFTDPSATNIPHRFYQLRSP